MGREYKEGISGKILMVVVICIGIMSIIGLSIGEKKEDDTVAKVDKSKGNIMYIDDMIEEYSNLTEMQKEYKSSKIATQTLELEGKVKDIKERGKEIKVLLAGSNSESGYITVRVVNNPDKKEKLMEFKVGDKINLKGKFSIPSESAMVMRSDEDIEEDTESVLNLKMKE